MFEEREGREGAQTCTAIDVQHNEGAVEERRAKPIHPRVASFREDLTEENWSKVAYFERLVHMSLRRAVV